MADTKAEEEKNLKKILDKLKEADLFKGTTKLPLHQGSNGDNVYSNHKAMYGFIEAAKFLVISDDILPDICGVWSGTKAPTVDLRLLGKKNGIENYTGLKGRAYAEKTDYLYLTNDFHITKLAALNFAYLTHFGMADDEAIIIAMYRARWIALGCLWTESKTKIVDSAKLFPEIIVVNGADEKASIPEIVENVANANSADEIRIALNQKALAFMVGFTQGDHSSAFVAMTAENFWSVSEFLFRTRGHHWKDEYKLLIQNMVASGYEGKMEIADDFPFQAVFHTAVHPFGIRALPIMAAHFAAHSKLGNSMMLRFNSAPNGSASITTSKAALDCMATEAWFTSFKKTFSEPVTVVEELSDAIMDDKYSYHNAAGLYGLEKKSEIIVNGTRYTMDEAKAKATPIATAAQGFINALAAEKEGGSITGFSLSNAEALKKVAANNPLLSLKVSTLVEVSLDSLQKEKTVSLATKAAFPTIKSKDDAEEDSKKKESE